MKKELESNELENVAGGVSISPNAAEKHCILGEQIPTYQDLYSYYEKEIYIKNKVGTDIAGTLIKVQDNSNNCGTKIVLTINKKQPATNPCVVEWNLDLKNNTLYLVESYY